VSPMGSEDEFDSDGDGEFESTRISDVPPMLPGIELGQDGIELPSRFPSKATSKASSRRAQQDGFIEVPLVPGVPSRVPSAKPTVPRKSSRRKSQSVDMTLPGASALRQHRAQASLDSPQHVQQRSLELPFERTNSTNRNSTISSKSSINALGEAGSSAPATALGNLGADMRNERPTSVGFVAHHSIRTVNQSENNPEYLGSSAVVVDGRHSGASSMENERR
jgi:hypothetical protein